jgi:hypothetical protein
VTFELKTARGLYILTLAKEPQMLPDGTLLTLSLERRDGIEKVTFQCRVDKALTGSLDTDALLGKLAHWIERDFEMTREYALKSIRSERRLMEIVFDASNRGPF